VNILTEKLLKEGSLASLKTRPARALIGWMPEREAQIMLAIPLAPATPLPEHVRRVKAAHAAVRSRPTGIDQTNVFSAIGGELRDYLSEFQEHPNYKQYIASGCSIRIANLNELCALQPVVHLDYLDHSDQLKELTRRAVQDDMISLVRITLPMSPSVDLPVQFDQERNAWIIRSRNPDTRIIGHFRAQVEVAPGLFGMGYGFCIALLPSFVQVVLYRGRYFLKDGYHRSLALLEKGITHIPVIYQEIVESQNLELEGRFPDEIILGTHPPQLPDYFRDDVAAAGFHLASQKTIEIQSMEARTWG
jgi:hypothetical protein